MSDESNKLIVKKAQSILKEFGYPVQTSHLYEMFAQLSGESSQNVAKAKRTSFKEKVLPKSPVTYSKVAEHYFNKWLVHSMNKVNFKLQLTFGVDTDNTLILREFGHALFIGNKDSHALSALYTTVNTFLLEHPETIAICLKETNPSDLSEIINRQKPLSPKIENFLMGEDGLVDNIHRIYKECVKRAEMFNQENVKTISEYEHKTNKALDKILLVMENFSLTDNLNYSMGARDFLSRLTQILATGANLGVIILAQSDSVETNHLSSFPHRLGFGLSEKESIKLSSSYFPKEINNTFERFQSLTLNSTEETRRLTAQYLKEAVQFPEISLDEWRTQFSTISMNKEYNCFYLRAPTSRQLKEKQGLTKE